MLDEILLDIFDDMEIAATPTKYFKVERLQCIVDQFQSRLEDCGFMIVPIEDPTNLRFGIDE